MLFHDVPYAQLFDVSTAIIPSRMCQRIQIYVLLLPMFDYGQPCSLNMVNHDWPSSFSQSI